MFAGHDPVTGKQTYLTGSTSTERDAERLRIKLLAQAQAQRGTATRRTLARAIDAWLETHEAEQTTIDGYRGYIDRTIKPGLGNTAINKLTPRMLEQFYAQLRRCRVRCNGKPFVEHRVDGPHDCKGTAHAAPRVLTMRQGHANLLPRGADQPFSSRRV